MQSTDVPPKFPIPFANDAPAGMVRAIPVPSQIGILNGAASLTDGFPPNTAIPIDAGGSWPWAQDMNGILKQVSAWSQWESAGGQVGYDPTFSAAIDGYPKGCLLATAATTGRFWLSTVENNVTNPDAGGAGWVLFPPFVAGPPGPPGPPGGFPAFGSGYQILPNGLKLEWVRNRTALTNGTGDATVNVVFPLAFASTVLMYVYCCDDEITSSANWGLVAALPTLSNQNVFIHSGIAGQAVACSGFLIGV